MTLQGLSKHLDKYNIAYNNSNNNDALESLKDLPFYNFQDSTDTKTFNYAIGLPRKGGVPCPLHDYEQMLYDTIQEFKHVWIKKAQGLVLPNLYSDIRPMLFRVPFSLLKRKNRRVYRCEHV